MKRKENIGGLRKRRVAFLRVVISAVVVLGAVAFLTFVPPKEKIGFEEQAKHEKEMQLIDTLVKYNVVKKSGE